MSLIDNLKNIFRDNHVEVVKKEAPVMSQRMDVFNLPEPPERKGKAYLEAMRGWVYIAVKAIAQEVAKIDLVLYKKTGKKIEVVENHEMIDLLDIINPFTTRNDFFEATQIYLELTGEAFWYKYKVNQKTRQMWLLRPDFIDILPPKKRGDYIGGYRYKVTGMKDPINYDINEVVHFKYFDPTNPYRGMGTLQAAAYAYDTDLFSSKWNRNFFFNNAMPTTLLTTEQNIKGKEIKRIKAEWKAKFGGVNKAHKMAILTGGLKVDDVLKQSVKDMDFLNLRKFSRDEILNIFQVPKSVIGITEDVNRANAQEGRIVWLDNVIKPKMVKLVSFLNEFFCPEWGDEYFFGFKDPSPSSVDNNLKLVKEGASILTINERRELIDYEPLPDGDVIFMPFGGNTDDKKDDTKAITIKGKKFKKREKKDILVKKRSKAEVIRTALKRELEKEGVRDKLKEMLFLTINNGKKVKAPKKKGDDKKKDYIVVDKDKREAFWKAMVTRSEDQEKTYEGMVNEFWKGQKSRIISKIKTGKSFEIKSVDSYLYDVDDENQIFVKFINELIEKIVAEAGTEALSLLGLTDTFNFTDQVLQSINDFEIRGSTSMNTTTRDLLRAALTEGISNNEGVAELTKRITQVYSTSKERAAMIARTETIRSNNFGNLEAYKQSGVVEMKEWMVALDERTCEFCLAMEKEYSKVGLENNFLNEGDILIGLDGGELKIDYGDLQTPPLHPRCRCTLLPVVTVAAQAQIDERVQVSKLKEKKEKLKKQIEKSKKKVDEEKENAKKIISDSKIKSEKAAKKEAEKIINEAKEKAKEERKKILKKVKKDRKEVRKQLYE